MAGMRHRPGPIGRENNISFCGTRNRRWLANVLGRAFGERAEPLVTLSCSILPGISGASRASLNCGSEGRDCPFESPEAVMISFTHLRHKLLSVPFDKIRSLTMSRLQELEQVGGRQIAGYSPEFIIRLSVISYSYSFQTFASLFSMLKGSINPRTRV